MNVLVYSGPGTTIEGVKQCIDSLRLHLSKYYAVLSANETVLLTEPWMRKTSMLVIPGEGGADLTYCQVLNGYGNFKIKKYVKNGGKFMGFGAGAYYASARCEFDVGGPLEVSGDRELAFYPGVCRGGAFKRYKYGSHVSARAAKLVVNGNELPNAPASCCALHNGGGVFIDSEKYDDVKVLARFVEEIDVEDEGKAAIVYRKVGKGDVILSGPHLEYPPEKFEGVEEDGVASVANTLEEHDKARRMLMREMLKKLGLRVCDNIDENVPKITPMYLMSPDIGKIEKVRSNLCANLPIEKGVFKDRNDTFVFEDNQHQPQHNEDGQTQCIKFITSGDVTTLDSTPDFNTQSYFKRLFQLSNNNTLELGTVLCYTKVITSTHTILEQNQYWLKHLPHGLVLTATTQIAGRGRGNNIWLNPKGVLPTTILFKIPKCEVTPSFIVCLQYVTGLALIEAILGYGESAGYQDMPVRIKWPNDIYMLKSQYFTSINTDTDTTTLEGDEEKYVKVGGSLLSSQFIDGYYYLIWGGGLNVSNEAPTTSLNVILTKLNELRKEKHKSALPKYELENLLAQIVFTINQFYSIFKNSSGQLSPFLPLYYQRWLHSNQEVVVSGGGHYGESRTCIIRGITPEYGLLMAQDVNNHEVLHLQPDGNSFDLFKGLVYKKNT
ncbi:BPL1 [Candida metapsilosis]|uniref:BPL1 n=1 Tax=Candida metapsilosis TaxID=273372 RepID=A0A8H7ZKI8_9ASCO|nr:BPL1 [Candida metapsilosis]